MHLSMKFVAAERKVIEIIIGDKEYEELQILTDDELIVSITDEDIIEKEGYKVVCVPACQ